MAFSINQVYLVGNIASDIDLRYTPNGNAVANFSLATNHSVKKGDNWEDVPTFHRIVVWGKLAEYASKNLHKGNKTVITGRIENGSYEKNGTKFYKSEIVADNVISMVNTKSSQTETAKEDDFDIPDPNEEIKQTEEEKPTDQEDIPF